MSFTTSSDIDLPLNDYYMSTTQSASYNTALWLAVGTCMRRFGYTQNIRTVISTGDQSAFAQVLDFGEFGNERRYGVSDVTTARTAGYHLRGELLNVYPQISNSDIHGLGSQNDRLLSLLSGVSSVTNKRVAQDPHTGLRVPSGGCEGEALRTLNPQSVDEMSALVSSLRHASFSQAGRTSTVKKSLDRWRRCMANAGYPGATSPIQVTSDLHIAVDDATPSTGEISAASASATCSHDSGYATQMFAAESSIQRRMIARHRATLRTQLARLSRLTARVSVALSEARASIGTEASATDTSAPVTTTS